MTSRAELLVQCQAKGLKATGWKKERMELELAKLEAPAEDAQDAAPLTGDAPAGSESGDDEKPQQPVSSSLSSYCFGAPMWSMHHLSCQRSVLAPRCSCECHAEAWVRPPYPEGARLSKFNPDRPAPEI